MGCEDDVKIPKSGKTKRKRSCKRKNKDLKMMTGEVEEKEEKIFNEGDGLIGMPSTTHHFVTLTIQY